MAPVRAVGASVATREQSGTNVDPGLIQRVVQGVRYMVQGVTPEAFFGPGQPIAPVAQDKAEGRQYDYPVAVNQRFTPRGDEAVSFNQLRGLADGYDLLRLVIETRKDQIEAFDWEIVPKEKADSADAMKDDIKRVTEFLEMPDKEHNWPQWLRMQIEEVLVTDALTVYPRLTRGGDLYALELVDGATIKRVLDITGRTPLPPDPAYQQILKGIPAVDYSRDQLVYKVRNPRVFKSYGYSPVEQVITTVNIALRRQLSQLDFYTQGNVPEALAQVPKEWTMKQIQEFQLWWDSVMEGNQAARRKMRFMPDLAKIVFPKDAVLKDEYDEWLARIVCFAFSISPSALIKQVNRASGEQMADTAKEEGLMPLLRFMEAHFTYLVQRYMGAPGLKFQFKVVNRVAPLQQAQIHEIYNRMKALTADEVREDLDRDALTPEQREAAFPTPITPGFDAQGNPVPLELGPDGKPMPGKDKTGKPLVGAAAAAEEKPVETPAEKMLAKALTMLDPERLAKAQPATVIELRPEINVEVGDTNVHNVTQRVAKKEVTTRRNADGSMTATSVES